MNRREFGQLLAALRQDLGWTQFQLAEFSELDIAVISQIERGVKKTFEPHILFRLANALQLTTSERREFILASTGLDESQIVRQPAMSVTTDTHNLRKMLDRLVAMTGEILLPAFLCDVYGDVLAVNSIMLAFYNIPPVMFETAASIPGGYNTVRVNFGKDMVGRTRVLDNWEQYAVNSMRTFRENSLRYRYKPYFKYLMKAFRNPAEYPFFDRFWKLVSSMEEDKAGNVDYFAYHHAEFGNLKYIASATTTSTSYGELGLYYYLPCDTHTDTIFTQLKETAGADVVRLASWPEKQMP